MNVPEGLFTFDVIYNHSTEKYDMTIISYHISDRYKPQTENDVHEEYQ